jgi:hypothetical protein
MIGLAPMPLMPNTLARSRPLPDRRRFIAERAFESLDCGVCEDPEAVRAFLSNGFMRLASANGGRSARTERSRPGATIDRDQALRLIATRRYD